MLYDPLALPRARSFHDAKLRDKAAANYLAHKRSERRTAAICATILAAFYASACLLLALGGLITQYGSPSVGLFLALSGLALLAMLTFGPRNPK